MKRLSLLDASLKSQQDILLTAKQFGQEHLIEHYYSIQDIKLKQQFLHQLSNINFKQANQLYKDVYLHHKNNQKQKQAKFEPLDNVPTRQNIYEIQNELDKVGFKSISQGQVGICMMSGGQGTRLGFNHPKGMYDIGLDSKFTLYEYFARKLLRLIQITKRKHPQSRFNQKNMIKWYIMTSQMNHQQIVNYFKRHNHFGYDPDSIYFFPQGGIPALNYNGKIIIQSQGHLSLAPGGNGAVYSEIKNKGALQNMKRNKVKYIYLCPVDNILLKLADPTCVGYMINNNYDIVSTYVNKSYSEQKRGIHYLKNGIINVCEYSQMPKQLAKLRDENGNFVYRHACRGTTLLTVDFIQKITTSAQLIQKINKKYHLAQKKIKYWDPLTKNTQKPDKNNGIKFELFYFDVFEQCPKIGLFETLKEEQVGPIKNPTGVESPESARKLLRDLHRKWLQKANIKIQGQGHVQIDPRICYNGEDLEEIVKQKYNGVIKLPAFIN